MDNSKEGQQARFNSDPKATDLQNKIDAALQIISMPPPVGDIILPTLPVVSPALQEEYESLLKEMDAYKKAHYPLLVDEIEE